MVPDRPIRRRKSRRYRRQQRYRFIALCCAIAVLLVLAIVLGVKARKEKKAVPSDSAVSVDIDEDTGFYQQHDISSIDISDSYQIKIDYPQTNYPLLDQEVGQYVEAQRTDFLDTISGKKPSNQDGYFDFIMNYDKSVFCDVISLHLVTFRFTGGNTYDEVDKTFLFDAAGNTDLTLSDLLADENSLSALSEKAKDAVIAYFDDNGTSYDSELVDQGTAAAEENYQHISLTDAGLTIRFVPAQVSSYADGTVEVTLPYSELNGILKNAETYQGQSMVLETEADSAEPRDLSQFEGKKLVAFTFDDGPSNSTTKDLVTRLKAYDARVTFFVLGSRVGANSDALKYAYESGHLIGSHTYNHLNLNKLDLEAAKSEIANTDEAVEQVLGIKPAVLRPPYGNSTEEVRQAAERPIILWDVDTLDWKSKDADAICQQILEHARDGSIILLHDIYQTSVDGCLKAMEQLAKDGYAFVTVEELAQIRGTTLENGQIYFDVK